MASSIPRVCIVPGCSSPATTRARCEAHAADHDAAPRRNDSARRRSDDPFRACYYLARWKHLRDLVLSEEPLCRVCKQVATDVDHVVRAKQLSDAGLFWDRSNLQPLCHSCHSTKTARERRARRVEAARTREVEQVALDLDEEAS